MSEEDAILEAGYSPLSRFKTKANLRDNERVQQQIKRYKDNTEDEDIIADSDDRQKLWTTIMNDPSFSGNIRLEASKLLGKAQGDFVVAKKIEHSVKDKPVILIPESSPKEWEKFWEKTNE